MIEKFKIENKKRKRSNSRLLNKTVELSHIFQSMQFKREIFIILFLACQKLFSTLLPLFLLLPFQTHLLVYLQQVIKGLPPFSEHVSGITHDWSLIVEVITMVLNIILLISLLSIRKRPSIESLLHVLILMYALSPLILILMAQNLKSGPVSMTTEYVKIISFVNIALLFILTLYFNIVSSSHSLINSNHICIYQNFYFVLHQMCIRMSCLFIPYVIKNRNNKNIYFLFVIWIFAFALVSLFISIKANVYVSYFTAKVNRLMVCFEFSSALISFLFLAFAYDEIIVANYWLVVPIVTMFAWVTAERYVSYTIQEYSLMDEQELGRPSQAIKYIWAISNVISNQDSLNKQQSELIMRNIKRKHEAKCGNASCFCQNTLEEEVLLKNLLTEVIDHISIKFEHHFDLILLTCQFKLEINQVYADSLCKLHRIRNKETENLLNNLKMDFLFQKFSLSLFQFLSKKTQALLIASTQKIKQSEDCSYNILNNWYAISMVKKQFWLFLVKEIIDYKKFSELIAQQLIIMRKLSKISEIILSQFSTNFLLITLLVAYERFILRKTQLPKRLFQKIQILKNRSKKLIFTNKGSEEKEQVEGYMYGKNCCCFESAIQTDKMGIILYASKNIESIFGYEPSAVQGQNIHRIMPASMQDEHDVILRNWQKRGTWENIGKVRNVFGVSRAGVSFSVSIYLKIIERIDTINIFATCFVKNANDFMLINSKGNIEGVGHNIQKVLGKEIIGLPLSFICSDFKQLLQNFHSNICGSYTSNFYDTKNLMNEIDEYHKLRYQVDLSELSQTEETIKIKIKMNRNFISLEYETSLYRVGSIKFLVIKVRKGFIEEEKDFERQIEQKTKRKEENEKDDFLLYSSSHKQYKTHKSFKSHKSIKSKRSGNFVNNQNMEENNLLHNGSSNLSLSGGSHNFSLQSILNHFEDLFLEKQGIKQKRIYRSVIIMIFLTSLYLAALAIKMQTYHKGFLQISDIFFADGACSDNMQLLQFSFNTAINMKVYRNQSELLSIRQSALFQHFYVQKLITEEILSIGSNQTDLTKKNFYLYQDIVIPWFSNKARETNVTTTDFMVNFLFLSQKVYELTQKNATDLEVNAILELMAMNFPVLKKINHANLLLYEDLFIYTDRIINCVGIVKVVVSFTLTIMLLMFLNYHYNFRLEQTFKLWRVFGQVSRENCLNLLHYFEGVGSCLKNYDSDLHANVKCFREKDIEDSLIRLNEELKNLVIENEKKIFNKLKISQMPSKNWKFIFLLIFSAIIFSNLYLLARENELLQICQTMMKSINQLMASQNVILEAYFDLKSEILIKNKSSNVQELTDRLLSTLNISETTFNKVASESMKIFANYDPNYILIMTELLTGNLCDLLVKLLPKELIEKCNKSQFSINILEHGLLASMNFFQKNVLSAIFAYKQSENINFLSVSFKSIDFSIFYMFKMYQQTQAQITRSLELTTNKHFESQNLIVLFQFALCFSMLAYTFCFYHQQQKKSADRFGMLFTIPVDVIKCTKEMINQFEKITEVENQS